MKQLKIRVAALSFVLFLCTAALSGCASKVNTKEQAHAPLTIMTLGTDYTRFEQALRETYPEVQLEFLSYAGHNATTYAQYITEHGEIPDIYTISVFGSPEEQQKNLLDLSGYEFVSRYKTSELNQVTIGGAVYLLPASMNICGLYYNKTLFAEKGWALPKNFEELKALTKTIRQAGIDPVAAQFELPGNGFYDLFSLAKTNFLSTPLGRQWESDFQSGKATAKEGLSEAANLLQQLIDCGFLDAEDTTRNSSETKQRFQSRQSAMYLYAGRLNQYTQNKDGSGDQYGILPFFGGNEDQTVLITLPSHYFGLSQALSAPGNEQKLADAVKVMDFLATEEGQKTLRQEDETYVSSLKDVPLAEDSPFYDVKELLQNGHTSTLAYAGYEPLLIGVGNKVRDWVAGKCAGNDVLTLMDQLQTEALSGTMEPVAVAAQDFTLEQTAQLEAQAFREKTGADIGLVSLGGYHNGVENDSGVCGKLFQGNISRDVINAIVPARFTDPVCVLTLKGAQLKTMLETGLQAEGSSESFPYVPAGLLITKSSDGNITQITLEGGAPLGENKSYTVAIDKGGFTSEVGQTAAVKETGQQVADVVQAYFEAHSPLAPLPPSLRTNS